MLKTVRPYLLPVAGLIVFVGIRVAESQYNGYSTDRNYISDLGVKSSSALTFNLSMLIAGLLIVLYSWTMHEERISRRFTWMLMLYGIGTACVGVFNSDIAPLHAMSALIVFATGPIVAWLSRKYVRRLASIVVVVLSALSLIGVISFVVASNSSNVGGLERWAIYPITTWLIFFGVAHHRKG